MAEPTQPTGPPEETRRERSGRRDVVVTTLLAFVAAIVVGGLLIAVSDQRTRDAAHYFFAYPWDTFRYGWDAISSAYVALFEGAIVNPSTFSSGDFTTIADPISETLVNATPLILTGLSVGIAFRAGLFNIGGQGQIIMGAIAAAYVGFTWQLPVGLHVVLAVLAGILGGALWGGLSGLLKAKTGAHEVITTIMLNWIALNMLNFLLGVRSFQRPPYQQAISKRIESSATLPKLLGSDLRTHAGLLIALAAAAGVWWLMERSTVGFQLRAVGANPNAARTAGMSVSRNYILVMLLAGGLAGLAGVSNVLGTSHYVTNTVDAGAGFDGITVALLGRGRPVGTILAGLLFGGLRAGGVAMQSRTGTPIDLVVVVQSLIVLFIAAPPLIRAIFRIRARGGLSVGQLAKGWNG